MTAVLLLFVVFGLIVVGIVAGLVLERTADAARLSRHLPRQERRLTVRENS